jgi:phosphoribosylamine--glycine ligase
MGCVSPVPFVDETFMQKTEERIIKPTVNGLAAEEIEYKGFIFFGLININSDPWVIEYNCRMGDPETEVVMPRLNNDVVELFEALCGGSLKDMPVLFDERACATVVAVSGGYPGPYDKGFVIDGLNKTDDNGNTIIFHAGTMPANEDVLTNGGRVLAVSSYGETIAEAAVRSKKALENISFKGMYYRNDIGYEFV